MTRPLEDSEFVTDLLEVLLRIAEGVEALARTWEKQNQIRGEVILPNLQMQANDVKDSHLPDNLKGS